MNEQTEIKKKIFKKSHLNLNFRTKQYRMKREKWQIIFIENYNVYNYYTRYNACSISADKGSSPKCRLKMIVTELNRNAVKFPLSITRIYITKWCRTASCEHQFPMLGQFELLEIAVKSRPRQSIVECTAAYKYWWDFYVCFDGRRTVAFLSFMRSAHFDTIKCNLQTSRINSHGKQNERYQKWI